jgi:peptide/nickel transport system substrate-binding protein
LQQQFKSDAAQAGIDITIKGQDYNTISGEVVPCKPTDESCSWQFAAIGGWIFGPDIYPTGETLFATGAGYNPGSYSDPKADSLIKASYEPGDDAATMKAYVDYLTEQVPVLWTENAFGIEEVKTSLHGVTPWNPLGFITPEDWYHTK